MSLVSFTPVVDGATATAASVNTPFSTIYNDYNGNITDANISSSAAIAFSKISGGSNTSLGTWLSWTPTWTNLTIGNATQVAKYTQIGKDIRGYIHLILGSSSSVGTLPTFTLPVTPSSNQIPSSWFIPVGTAVYATNGSSGLGDGMVFMDSTGKATPIVMSASGTYVVDVAITATVPGTWSTGYMMRFNFEYEAA